jgi:hypothetical protein
MSVASVKRKESLSRVLTIVDSDSFNDMNASE